MKTLTDFCGSLKKIFFFFETWSLELEIGNWKFWIWNFENWNFGILRLEILGWNLELEIWDFEILQLEILKIETWDLKILKFELESFIFNPLQEFYSQIFFFWKSIWPFSFHDLIFYFLEEEKKKKFFLGGVDWVNSLIKFTQQLAEF